MKDDAALLVCARADKPVAVPGSIFTERCTVCAERVMIAPSGQRLLKQMPALIIVCDFCVVHVLNEKDTIALAAAPDEIRREVKSAQPNFWRKRN